MLHLRFRQLALVALTGLVVIPLALAPRQATAMHSSPSDLVQPHITRELSADEAKAQTTVLLPPSPTPVVPLALRTPNGPQREVFGFVQPSVMGDAGVGYPSWDFSMLTTVAYFGVHVNWDGHLVTNDNGWYWWNSGTLTNLVNAAHSHGVKVVLTIILQDGSGGQNLMCSGLGGMDNTVSDGVREIAAKGVDGINLDYEGQNAPCFNNGIQVGTTQSMLIAFVQKMRSAMPTGSYLSIDSYSGSGQGPDGFFNLPALAPYVDSFFVMAYDMEYYNWVSYCSAFCLGPTAPVAGYLPYNDTRTATEYTATVPASKVILGVPYYGRKACVSIGGANDYPTSSVAADGYLDAAGEQAFTDTAPGTYSIHRDVHDAIGQERFDDWLSYKYNCTRQLYWDDFVSLGAKYDLVNRYNLRGVGIFTLNYGGGAPELWCDLRDHFSAGYVPATANVSATQTTTSFALNFTAGQGCGVSLFDVQQQDTTIKQPWVDIAVGMAPTSYVNQAFSGTLTAAGYQGHTYQFRVRTHDGKGNIGSWSLPASTAVATTATPSHPFRGMYTMDAYGDVGPEGSPPVATSGNWPGWKIARTGHAVPGANSPESGLYMDGYGGLHTYGSAIATVNSPAYWQGWDIARDFAFLPDGSGGYLLDGYGGLHPFSVHRSFGSPGFALNRGIMPPPVRDGPYWSGWDIARKVVIFSDGTGGYVLDGFGGVQPFGIGQPAPPKPVLTGYWPGWDIAHDIALIPGTHSGYVMDGYGGVHPFAPPGQTMPPTIQNAYAPGKDIARAIWLVPSSTLTQPEGYLLDGYGGLHPLGAVPAAVVPAPYWGYDITRSLWGA